MVDITEHKEKLKKAREEYKRANGFRRRDLGKYIKRLQKEQNECKAHLNGTYGKART